MHVLKKVIYIDYIAKKSFSPLIFFHDILVPNVSAQFQNARILLPIPINFETEQERSARICQGWVYI